ncbi:MAG: MBL fold metallo-hydrolase [Alistipes senegalensis]|nr:MBL fold metallo-hydrolase [Oxalobacter formigenes]MCM1281601.1 MBL fold metallo-hydrolase [Alistipes senegalensis]
MGATPGLVYPFGATPPAFGCPVEVAPGILWLRLPLPLVLDHVNVWLVADGDGWCAVDTGLAWKTGRAIWRQWLGANRLTRQVATHHHPDHIGLAGWLYEEEGAALWMSQGEYLTALAFSAGAGNYHAGALADLFCRHGLDAARLARFKQAGDIFRAGVSPLPPDFCRLADNQLILIGGHEWQVMTGRGHAVEHVSLYCASLGVLIAGDMLLPGIASNVPVMPATPRDDPLRDYLMALRRYRALPPEVLVLPAHGRPFTGAAVRADWLETFHRCRTDRLLARLAEPLTACEVLPDLFNWGEMNAHQLMFAMGEAIACLHYLEGQHRVVRLEAEEGGFIRFQAC